MTALTYQYSNPSVNFRSSLLPCLGILTVFALFNFPILAFFIAGALLINLSRATPDIARRLLGLVLVVAVSMILSSRPISDEGSEDIVGYYYLYEAVRSGDFEQMFQFGGGIEVGLPLLFYLWGLLLPKLSVNGLMLCLALTSSVLFWAWVEVAFYGKNRRGADMALMGAALLLFNVYLSTQLARQFLSMVLLLYAFSATTTTRRTLFVMLAAAFHLTAVLFYGVYLLARRGRLGIVLLIALVVLSRMYFPVLLTLLDVLPDALVEKLAYYVDNNSEYTDSDIASLKLIGLLCIISLLATVASGFRLDRRTRLWHAIPWVTAVVHLLLLPIPLASLRSTLAVHSVATGLVAYKMIAQRHRLLLLTIFNVLLLYKLAGFVTLEGDAGLVSTMSVLMNAFQ
ncbi:EpsG family protein [Methylibium sp.]|uniref:EpsG family protein n=1 Tax=Methylibium sp. TaxID=2067992 RepID=UPI003D0C0FD0